MGGIVPFSSAFIELRVLLEANMFDLPLPSSFFLLLNVVLVIMACAGISVILCYFQLCQEVCHETWMVFIFIFSSSSQSFFCYFFSLELSMALEFLFYISNFCIIYLLLHILFSFFISPSNIHQLFVVVFCHFSPRIFCIFLGNRVCGISCLPVVCEAALCFHKTWLMKEQTGL